MNTARNFETTSVTAPFDTISAALLAWCVQLAQESCSNLYVLQGEDGNAVITLEAGTHGRLDAIIEYGDPIAYTDEVEMMAIKAFANLEASGSHTVRWTSRGVRAYLDADWTRRYAGRINGAEPAEFNSAEHRPWYLQPVPDAPKSEKTSGGVGAWKGFKHPLTPKTYAPPPPPPSNFRPNTKSVPDPWDDDELAAICC